MQTVSPSGQSLSLALLRRDVLDRAQSDSQVVVNLSDVKTLSSLDAAALLELVLEGKERGIEVRFSGLSDAARQAFIGLDADLLERLGGSVEHLSPVEA